MMQKMIHELENVNKALKLINVNALLYRITFTFSKISLYRFLKLGLMTNFDESIGNIAAYNSYLQSLNAS